MPSIELGNDAGITITLLENGAIAAIRSGGILVNQVVGHEFEGALGNVYLRRHDEGGTYGVPLVGPRSPSRFVAAPGGARWEGAVDGLRYACTLRIAPDEPAWFWTVAVANATERTARLDVLLAQDLGLAAESAVRTNELYTSQYIDHTALDDPKLGYLVCSRQNLPQDGAFPWVMHGCVQGGAGFLTDGYQFYGLDHRVTNTPAALRQARLPNRVHQFELAMPTVQSEAATLAPGESLELTFFAAYQADHPDATSAADTAHARRAAAALDSLVELGPGHGPADSPRSLFATPAVFESRDLATSELRRWFGTEWRHVEERDGVLLSFFHGYQMHVVLRAKESVVERPTGHIMRSGRDLLPIDDGLAATAWMFGVFGSQLTIGNTSLHKVLSVVRNPLNVLKASGLRIAMRTDRGWELLGVPSAFEMGPNTARWIYADDTREVSVTAAASLEGPAYRLLFEVVRGGPLELLVTHELVLGEHEGGPAPDLDVDVSQGRVTMRPAATQLIRERYPDARFHLVVPDADAIAAIGSDDLLALRRDGPGGPGGQPGRHLVVRTRPVRTFSLAFTGSLLDPARAESLAAAHARGSEPEPPEAVTAFWRGLGHGATLGGGSDALADDVQRLNDVVRWYLHNGLIHLSSPHGLEQSGGAAWGVRDVCQGPVELLLATGNPGPVRDILLTLYAHQYRQTGDWPQWFMFDRYRELQQVESHGDVVHWPLKALCDYVEATDDLSILDEHVPYTDERTLAETAEREPLFAHTERLVARIERECVPGTALPIFGGGDWEDTLQPADAASARRMVSTWTAELAYQTVQRYGVVCGRSGHGAMAERLAALADRIRSDVNRHLLPDGVATGLALFGDGEVEYFLHPRDRRTGVRYRLLPMTRGIISGLFSAEQATAHLELIERHLSFPDGVRLMDRPMAYRGGTSRFFRRAETAANFGREVGLQYVHAHIRYVEAMARLGMTEAAFRGLLAICPILLERTVPPALPRQANAYFSSSDAAFSDRYEASRRFDELRDGGVDVRGGWRVYSSGPGIFINQLISNVLGIRSRFDAVVLDPVLPRSADGLTFDFEHEGRAVRYAYRVTGPGFGPREVRINGRTMSSGRSEPNPYRRGGLMIPRSTFDATLDRESNLVEIEV